MTKTTVAKATVTTTTTKSKITKATKNASKATKALDKIAVKVQRAAGERDLKDGESILVDGSGSAQYTIKNTGGVYSCSCPAWRNQKGAGVLRTCKHIKRLRGEAAELARIGAPSAKPAAAPEPSAKTAAAKKPAGGNAC